MSALTQESKEVRDVDTGDLYGWIVMPSGSFSGISHNFLIRSRPDDAPEKVRLPWHGVYYKDIDATMLCVGARKHHLEKLRHHPDFVEYKGRA